MPEGFILRISAVIDSSGRPLPALEREDGALSLSNADLGFLHPLKGYASLVCWFSQKRGYMSQRAESHMNVVTFAPLVNLDDAPV